MGLGVRRTSVRALLERFALNFAKNLTQQQHNSVQFPSLWLKVGGGTLSSVTESMDPNDC